MLEKENVRLKKNLAYHEKALARARGVWRCRKFESIIEGTVDRCDFSDDTYSDESSDGDDDPDENEEDDEGEYDEEDEEGDTDDEEDDEPSRKKKEELIGKSYIPAAFKYTNCTIPLSSIVWKSKEMDPETFVCKKCFFTTERLEKLNTHAKKIHVVHNVGKAPDEKPRTTPRSGFHTRETFDEIIDELETRDPPVDIRIVISAIITKSSETKRKKEQTAKHSFEFMILDATEPSS